MFAEAVTKQWNARDSLEGDLYALWVAASEIRKQYNSTMAATIWHSMSLCDWPLCAGDSSTTVRLCEMCDAYSACAACSKIDPVRDLWPLTELYVLNTAK